MTEQVRMCCEIIRGSFSWSGHACPHRAKVERDGKWYCGTHDPVAAKARRDKKHAEWDEQHRKEIAFAKARNDARQEADRRARRYDDMLAALRRAVVVLAAVAETMPVFQPDYEAIDTAIKKATGEQS